MVACPPVAFTPEYAGCMSCTTFAGMEHMVFCNEDCA